MRPCIVKSTFAFKRLGVGQTPKWPSRLKEAPERAHLFSGGSEGGFRMDTRMWKDIRIYYKTVLPDLGTNKIRNVMDMNTKYGGFASSLIDDPVWVMNVVSVYSANSLGTIYDRGLIGTMHDWFVNGQTPSYEVVNDVMWSVSYRHYGFVFPRCEAFSTYPRTYDLLHVDGLFTSEIHRYDFSFL